jgi:hypothetical protein
MIYRVFFILAAILSGFEDDKITSYSIEITGVVTDQVTGQPVEGATVSLGVQRGAMPGDGLAIEYTITPIPDIITAFDISF